MAEKDTGKKTAEKNPMIIEDKELTITELSLIWNQLSAMTVLHPINKTVIHQNQEQLRPFVGDSQADEAVSRAENAARDKDDFLIEPDDPKKEYVWKSDGKVEFIKAANISGKKMVTIPKMFKFFKNNETLALYLNSHHTMSFLFPDFKENPNVELKEL